ncbi:hypothetical protein LB505_006977 [Fusarium chuoi]|nr:hypothetical protein LB505_006977 [Fusarium chuoi]
MVFSPRNHACAMEFLETHLEKVRRHDPNLFESASYGHKAAVLMNYLPSAAWTWAVCEQEHPRLIMYNDV